MLASRQVNHAACYQDAADADADGVENVEGQGTTEETRLANDTKEQSLFYCDLFLLHLSD